MPKSPTRTPSGSWPPAEPLGDLDAEPVVAEEDVADPGDERLHRATRAVSGSTSSGWKNR